MIIRKCDNCGKEMDDTYMYLITSTMCSLKDGQIVGRTPAHELEVCQNCMADIIKALQADYISSKASRKITINNYGE